MDPKVPTLTGKPGKNDRAFSSQGKVREHHKKYLENENISDKYYLIFLVIFKLTLFYLVK